MERKSLLKNILVGIRSFLSRRFENPYRIVGLSTWKVKVLKHLPDGKLRTIKILGQPFFFISPSELIHGLKEIFIEKIYDQALPANARIIDCGANIGLSVLYLKKLCPDAQVIAFEPDPVNYSLLTKNIQSFELQHVELKEAAVWTENTTLHFSSGGTMGSSISSGTASGTLQVKAVRLKDYLNEPVDFLKIDIEGAEYEVIRDIADSLHNVKKMFLEYHGRFDQNIELLEMLEHVRKAGFRFYIKEAAPVYPVPFRIDRNNTLDYDVQLNIFCIKP